jgi:hypothetical protein
MSHSHQTPARSYAKGIGEAVADRTINRKIERPVPRYFETFDLPRDDSSSLDSQVAAYTKSKGLVIDGYEVLYGDELVVTVKASIVAEIGTETWADVAERVATGNAMLHPVTGLEKSYTLLGAERKREFDKMHHHLRQASLLMSGRHLQHGDATQPSRNMEVFTNCSTSASRFLTFYLLLNGSGVGTSYDDAMQAVDFYDLPITVPVIDWSHSDARSGEISALDLRTAQHLYASREQVVFEVPDSREGWAKALEKMELMAFQRVHRNKVLLLDFSKVRPRGSPIGGMQNRPASGPGPLMTAIKNVAALRDAGMDPWRAAMYADHYLAECVLVGGARRAARMATKSWRDKNVLDFVSVKRGGFLWSSNNSVTVDEDFWNYVKMQGPGPRGLENTVSHAKAVFEAVCQAAYHDGTGEPGLINVERLTWSDDGSDELLDGNYAESARYKLEPETLELTRGLAQAWKKSQWKVITNPCGEIVLNALGGYCVIADVVPYHAQNDEDAEDAFRVATRALIRTNLMDCLYSKEVKRTNRIGVGMTGLHEYAWSRFGFGWHDIIDEEKSQPFWQMLSRFKRAVQDEAASYSFQIGVTAPHTDTTMKPAGTTSKLFGLTEGAHLPSMREYLRYVQFRNDDPLIAEYQALGYPVKKLRSYSGTTIVGFPTKPEICALGMGDKLVTAAEATMAEQYQYIRLLEKYWLTGVAEDGVTPLRETGNQISYTAKYLPAETSFELFRQTLLEGQSTIRCCSVMPQTDASAYEYQPETPLAKGEYEKIVSELRLDAGVKEDIGLEHVDCAGGACPVDFNQEKAA